MTLLQGDGSLQVRRGPRARRVITLNEDLAETLRAALEATTQISFPTIRYRQDPLAFCREILGIELWDKQKETAQLICDHRRVAVAAGRKVGKSTLAACIALWYFCSFPDARVVLTSVTSRQVDEILWRELRMLVARGGRCLDCKRKDPNGLSIRRPCPHSALIDASNVVHELARSGLKIDFREITGHTSRESEALAGISGKNLLYIVDEASGVDDVVFEAIAGNMASASAKILMIGNPTRNDGEFYEAFHGKAGFFKTLQIASTDSPNVKAGKEVFPGMADPEWIELMKQEYGEDSAWYSIHVKGQFAVNEEGKVISLHAIALAEAKWDEMPETGRLFIGLDPAGPGGQGDDSVFAVRRGYKILAIYDFKGLTDETHRIHLLDILGRFKKPGDQTPVVVVDREGQIGSSLYGFLHSKLNEHRPDFELVGVRSSEKAVRRPKDYDRMRDELWAVLSQWFRDGGTIPTDPKLEKELHAPEWVPFVNGRVKVTPKEIIRKMIGRSPDRADAVALAVWEASWIRNAEPGGDDTDSGSNNGGNYDNVSGAINPYGGGINPYG